MKVFKIHTSNSDKLKTILDNLVITGNFFDYNLKYESYKYEPRPFTDECDEHNFNLPEFKWSEHLNDRTIFEISYSNNTEKNTLLSALGKKPTKLPYTHYELDPHPKDDYEYHFTYKIHPKYPIYVITKGRWEKTLTIDTLEDMGIDFYICVEPKEYDKYAQKVDVNKILKLPENFSERGQGGIPVRNFVWEHSVQNGHPKHWIIDDNIDGFFRWNENLQKRVRDGVFFRIMEDFSDRYENLGLVSCQYFSFIPEIDTGRDPFIINTRTYSCILINSELLDTRLTERWRGTYNEDTDLTLRVLSTGDLCTVNFNSLLSGKQATGSMKGGNLDTIYDEGRHTGYMKKFQELKNTWGNIVKLTFKRHKDGRPHHHISYTKLFKQKLILKDGVEKEPKVNNYNMEFKHPTHNEN